MIIAIRIWPFEDITKVRIVDVTHIPRVGEQISLDGGIYTVSSILNKVYENNIIVYAKEEVEYAQTK